MFRLIDNSQVAVDSWEGFRSTIAENSQIDNFGTVNAAHRSTQVLSGAFTAFATNVYTSTLIGEKQLTFNISIGNVLNVGNMAMVIDAPDGTRIATKLAIAPNTVGFSNYELTGSTNSNYSGFSVGIFANEAYDVSVPRRFDFFGEFVLIDSLNNINITPDFDFEQIGEKVENRHRVRSGEQYVYKWGEIRKFQMGVSYVDSGFKSVVNSHWKENTELLFVQSGDMRVNSVRIGNTSLPVGEFIEPYMNLFKGTIQLETY